MSQTMENSKKLKIKLGEKYVSQMKNDPRGPFGFCQEDIDIVACYVAGFDRAKALCVDHILRTVGKERAEILNTIGEGI